MFRTEDHPLLGIVKHTCGLQNGHRTSQEVFDLFGVNVEKFPTLFRVTKTNLVVKMPRHEEIYQHHMAEWRELGHRLGCK